MYADPKKYIRSYAQRHRKANKSKVATVATVNRIVNRKMETKIFQPSNISSSTGNTWSFNALSAVANGNTNITRVGDEIYPKYLKVRGTFLLDPDNATGYDTVRIIVVRDKEARGAVPTGTELGLSSDGYGITDIAVDDNNFKSKRFEILYDKVIQVTLANHGNFRFFKINKKLKGKMYFGTEGGDYLANALFLGIWTAHNTANQMSTITATSRLYFKDT